MWTLTTAATRSKDTLFASLLTGNHSIRSNRHERFRTTASRAAFCTFVHSQYVFSTQWCEDAVKMISTWLCTHWFRPMFWKSDCSPNIYLTSLTSLRYVRWICYRYNFAVWWFSNGADCWSLSRNKRHHNTYDKMDENEILKSLKATFNDSCPCFDLQDPLLIKSFNVFENLMTVLLSKLKAEARVKYSRP